VSIDLADAHRHRAERPAMATAPPDVAPDADADLSAVAPAAVSGELSVAEAVIVAARPRGEATANPR
jgi:hypothetical protein